MIRPSVCGVVVTYHPSASMIDHASSILDQLEALVFVDNGSTSAEVGTLRAASEKYGIKLIENGENLGVAEALNRGVEWARVQGYSWVALFDQDSTITEGFVSDMLATWESHPQRERLGSLHPKYVDPDTGEEAQVWRAPDGGPVISMTSGALMPTWIFERIGLFASDFFIDQVDWEYCLRIRAAGYLIADSRRAELLHCAGHPTSIQMLGFTFHPSHHSAVRRYYITRNRIVLWRRYFPRFPGWMLATILISIKETLKCFLAEKDRLRKLRNLILGSKDALLGRMGRRDDL